MNVVQILADEHRLLTGMLFCLELLTERAAEEDRLDGEAAQELLVLFDRFADGAHQDKEELLLFPVLLVRAPSDTVAELRGLAQAHARERALLEAMHGHLEGACYQDPIQLDAFVAGARAYVRLQRAHIREENRLLLPLACRLLEAEDDRRMLAEFRSIDAIVAPLAVEERVLGLCRRLGVALATGEPTPGPTKRWTPDELCAA